MQDDSQADGVPPPDSPTDVTRLGAFQYFRYLTLIIVAAFSALALEHAYLGLRWLLLVDTLGALGLLLIRGWVMRAGDATRLVTGTHLVTTLCLAVLLGHALATGQNRSLATWFLPVLPVVAAFLGGTRAAVIWIGVTILTTLGMWFSEALIAIPPNLLTSPQARALARIVLILIGAAFGITARRISERQTYALVTSLMAEQEAKHIAEKARRQAEAASRAKSDFLATVSHEIRTPLNSMIGLTSLLLDRRPDDTAHQYLVQVRRSGELLLHLVNDILDYARLEAGQLVLEPRPFDPHAVMDEARAIIAPLAQAKGLRLRLDVEAPHVLRGDGERLRQILLALLDNAVKFTSEGEIRVACHPLPREGSQTWLRVEIQDAGIGIEPVAAADLFQPFTQADASTTRRYGGSGLGLAICRTLAELMGGEIGYDSVPGVGTTFWVNLPFERQDTAPPSSAARAEAVAAAAPGDTALTVRMPCRVLLAEDNPVNQFVAAEMLRHLQCEVVVVGDGRRAVEVAQVGHFDMVFMDCDMPELDGFEATRAIRAHEPAGAHVPIIAMTAAAFEGDRERCLETGMDDFLPKPVRLGDLTSCIVTWQGKGRVAGEGAR